MNDNDMIRRGDVLKLVDAKLRDFGFGVRGGRCDEMRAAINAIPATAPEPAEVTAARVVKIKPLEWEDRGHDWSWWPADLFWPYRIRLDGAFHVDVDGETVSSHASFDQAKAAAQADYEARIRSAIVEGK